MFNRKRKPHTSPTKLHQPKVIWDRRKREGWIKAYVLGYECTAKMYNRSSTYGLNGGRISKLQVKLAGREMYNFDRGLDFDRVPQGHLCEIITFFEELPKTSSKI